MISIITAPFLPRFLLKWNDGFAQHIRKFSLTDLYDGSAFSLQLWITPALRTPFPLHEALPVLLGIFQHRPCAVPKHIYAAIARVMLQVTANNGGQPVQTCVHTGDPAYQTDPLCFA